MQQNPGSNYVACENQSPTKSSTGTGVKFTPRDPLSHSGSNSESTYLRFRLSRSNNLIRIFSYGTKVDRCIISVAIALAAITGAALPLMIVVFGKMVKDFNDYGSAESNVSTANSRSGIKKNVLYFLYIFAAKVTLGYISIYWLRRTGFRVSAAARVAYLTALFEQPMSVIDSLPPGAAIDSLSTLADTIHHTFTTNLRSVVQSLALVVSAYVIAFTYSWSLALVSSSALLVGIVIQGAAAPSLLKIDRAVAECNSNASAVAAETFQIPRTIKSLYAENAVSARYAQWVASAQNHFQRKSPIVAFQFSASFFSIYAVMGLTFWVGTRLYAGSHISDVGAVLIALFSVLAAATSLGDLSAPIHHIQKAASAASLHFHVVDAPKMVNGGLTSPEVDAGASIRFDEVRFAYPNRPQIDVLKGLSLTFQAGKTTALIGPSGSGKSTIVALLQRWYDLGNITKSNNPVQKQTSEGLAKAGHDPTISVQGSHGVKSEAETMRSCTSTVPGIRTGGTIFVGNHDLASTDRKWWRSQLSLVQQEPVLFNESIYENVARGLTGSPWAAGPAAQTRSLVQEACKQAYADHFVQDLPDGYDTLVVEGGSNLSGGQRQRIAVARSVVKSPKVLILDEATSSLDSHGESIVAAALHNGVRGRTIIMIAHRMSTVRNADHIIVLGDGIVAEEGTHDELSAREGGVYASMLRIQDLEPPANPARCPSDPDDITSKNSNDLAMQRIGKPAVAEEDLHNRRDEPRQTEHRPRSSIRSLAGLFRKRTEYTLLCTTLVGCIFAGAIVPVQAYFFARVATTFQNTNNAHQPSARIWSLAFFILAIYAAVIYAIIGYSANKLSGQLVARCRQEYFSGIMKKPVPWFDDNTVGGLTGRLSRDPQQIQNMIGLTMALSLIAAVNMAGCVVISFAFGWKLALVSCSTAFPIVIIASLIRIRFEKVSEELNARIFAESNKFVAESISAFRTVAALTLEDEIIERYRSILARHVDKETDASRFKTFFFTIAENVNLCCMALVFWYGGKLLANGEYNVEQFLIIYIAVMEGGQASGQFLGFMPEFTRAAAAASNNISSFRDLPEESPSQDLVPIAPRLLCGKGGLAIHFRDVGFAYTTRNIPVLQHFNLQIAAGEYVAIVGPSGCGKTTIISLLERFYDVSSGLILVDDMDLARAPLMSYRSVCGMVTQEPSLFASTVRENLVVGLPTISSPEDLEEACKLAGIHDFILSLPHSFDTLLLSGTHASMSGGQKQRLCLARSLLRKPRLLLLDEVTSNLDGHCESAIQKTIDGIAARGDVTIVATAHRLSTVQNAHRIGVLGSDGRIAEEGTHTQLFRQRGIYWRMCQTQALQRS